MYLFINSALSEIELALFNKKELSFYKKWKAQDESLEIIQELQKQDLENLEGVIVSQGPGRFTSLRVAIAYAQTLAFIKKLPLYGFKTEEYFQVLLGDSDIATLQQIGIGEVFFNGKLTKFEDLPQKSLVWSGEVKTPHLLPSNWEEKTLPDRSLEFFQKLLEGLSHRDTVSVFYGKEPSIQIANNK